MTDAAHQGFQLAAPQQATAQQATADRPSHAVLRRQLRRRQWLDLALCAIAVPAAPLLLRSPHDQLLVAILGLSLAMLFLMIRRGQDMATLRNARLAQAALLEGRGLSVSQWHSGAPLAPWSERDQTNGSERDQAARSERDQANGREREEVAECSRQAPVKTDNGPGAALRNPTR